MGSICRALLTPIRRLIAGPVRRRARDADVIIGPVPEARARLIERATGSVYDKRRGPFV
jgi:hypothetical protein